MRQNKELKRLSFDLLALVLGAGMTYLSYIVTISIETFDQWDRYIILIFTSLIAGIIVGFFAFKTEGLIIVTILGTTMLSILTIFGVKGIGLSETSGNYFLSLFVYILIGILSLCNNLFGSFLGRIVSPKLWKAAKGEIEISEIADAVQQTTKVKERIFCKNCGSEVPHGYSTCEICGTSIN
ncbi:MAG: zinc ribbon domain-containing protein [Candidatus Heimdallarchaeota archaeon]|nr:zinc ribbon domain-containing protein [Candidatus Heimdallarchaeota archaeon]